MAFVHRLVQTLLAREAQRARLEPDQPIMIGEAGEMIPLSTRGVSGSEISRMLSEIAEPTPARPTQAARGRQLPV